MPQLFFYFPICICYIYWPKQTTSYLICPVSFNKTIHRPPLSIPMYYISTISFISFTNATFEDMGGRNYLLGEFWLEHWSMSSVFIRVQPPDLFLAEKLTPNAYCIEGYLYGNGTHKRWSIVVHWASYLFFSSPKCTLFVPCCRTYLFLILTKVHYTALHPRHPILNA